jgi:hypothetical protein
VTCEFCGATNYVDHSRVVFHYAVQPTIETEKVLSTLRRWMGSNLIVKNLDRKAKLGETRFEYYPMWMVRTQLSDGDRVIWEPGTIPVGQELKYLSMPAGNLEPYKPNMGAKVVLPIIQYEMLQKKLQEKYHLKEEAIQDVALVHVPIFKCEYF